MIPIEKWRGVGEEVTEILVLGTIGDGEFGKLCLDGFLGGMGIHVYSSLFFGLQYYFLHSSRSFEVMFPIIFIDRHGLLKVYKGLWKGLP